MKGRKILGIVLLTAGLLALVYGGFNYTKDRHDLDLGLFELSVHDKERVIIPPWVGVIAIVAGVVLLAARK